MQRERDEARAEMEIRKEALLDAVEQIEGLRILRDRWYERAKRYEKERDEARAEVERATDDTEEDEPLTIEQKLRIELAWRTLERDRALAQLKHLSRRPAECVDAPLG